MGCWFKRAVMKELTTAAARSRADDSPGRGVAFALQSAPPRTNANVVPFGAQTGERYVPALSLVRSEPSGRTAYRSVSVPTRITSWLDQLESPEMNVAIGCPWVSATTVESPALYRTRDPSGDQPRNAPVPPIAPNR